MRCCRRARLLASNDLGSDASAAVAALEGAAGTDEQRLLALDARLELTMTRYEIDEALRLGRQAIDRARALGRADLELRFAIIRVGRAVRLARSGTRPLRCSSPMRRGCARTRASTSNGSTGRPPHWRWTTPTGSRDAMPRLERGACSGRAGRAPRHALEDDVEHGLHAGEAGSVREAAKAGAAARQLALAVERWRCRCACCRCR